MKILFLWNYSLNYLNYFYNNNKAIKTFEYKKQIEKLINDFSMWNLYMVPYLQKMGLDIEIIIGNSYHSQKQWCIENNLEFSENEWQLNTVYNQVKKYKPDILWFSGSDIYFGSFLTNVKKYCKYIIAWKAASFSKKLDWTNIDGVLSSHPNFVNMFKKYGKKSELLLPCFEPLILSNLRNKKRNIDISFTGNLPTISHIKRLEFLKSICDEMPLRFYSEKVKFNKNPIPIKLFVSQFKFLSFLKGKNRYPAVYGVDMFDVLRSSKIIINTHVDIAEGFAGNIRMFESTGCGSLLITEDAPNLDRIFKKNIDVITYRNNIEAKEKIKYYLENKKERNKIAKSGQDATFINHNPKVRSAEFMEIISKWFGV